jgi:hypothetical protein
MQSIELGRPLDAQATSPPKHADTSSRSRPDRPCDACRRRKSRCEINENAPTCVMCAFHHQECTFVEIPQPRKRKLNGSGGGEEHEAAKIWYVRYSVFDMVLRRPPAHCTDPIAPPTLRHLEGCPTTRFERIYLSTIMRT